MHANNLTVTGRADAPGHGVRLGLVMWRADKEKLVDPKSSVSVPVILVTVVIVVGLTILAALTQWRPELRFVRLFLGDGKLWSWVGVLLWGCAQIADAWERRTKWKKVGEQ